MRRGVELRLGPSATIAFCLLLFTSPLRAQEIERPLGEPVDTWSEPNPGLRYLRRTLESPPLSIHAVVVDLRAEGVRVVATPQASRWATVSDFAREQRAAVAINGGFWGVWQRPTGITAGGGSLWSGSEPDPEFGHFGIRSDGRAVVHGPGEGEDARSLARLTDSVSGRPLLVVGGELATDSLDVFASANQRQPRTAAGVSRDGRTVFLVVADGRQSHSRGLTLYQLARVMIELGAHRAINLDGGGSSALFVKGRGVINRPSDGTERPVANHLAIVRSESGGVDACPYGALASVALARPIAAPPEAVYGVEPVDTEDGGSPWAPLTAACAVLVLGAAAWRTR